jgi:hypothetical protein
MVACVPRWLIDSHPSTRLQGARHKACAHRPSAARPMILLHRRLLRFHLSSRRSRITFAIESAYLGDMADWLQLPRS